MADQDLATRAPESDLVEESLVPGDSVVDQGASLGLGVSELKLYRCSIPLFPAADMKMKLTLINRNTAHLIDPPVRLPRICTLFKKD